MRASGWLVVQAEAPWWSPQVCVDESLKGVAKVNKRARNRLVGIAVIVVFAVAAILVGTGADGAYSRTVSDVAGNTEFAGDRVRVTGTVIDGSWNRKINPMIFDIRNEGATDGPQIRVEYQGNVPATFGDGVIAIITGTLNDDSTKIISDTMVTVCPSRYEAIEGALSVDDLLASPGEGYRVVTGFVAAGSIKPVTEEFRFKVQNSDSGGSQLSIIYQGALPSGMDSGSQVVLGGEMDENGAFVAVSVALSEAERQ